MPGKVKVKIIAGRNLPVMDRSSDTTDAYVEIKLGNTTYKTDVCRKSLNPQWNSEWYRFEVDDSELQDEPLQIRLMDHDTYSANDAIGKVYMNLNPLLNPVAGLPGKYSCDTNINDQTSSSVMSGWIPVYDTMHGIRGEVNVIVKVELFSDFNKFRQSSCGVQFFCSPVIPHGYHTQVIHGFVEELVVNDDPEYQWIDKIRTPRASNEARQTLFFKLSGELQRKIGVKTLDLGGNAVIGYSQCFDLEGESGIVARGIGTAVTLIKHHEIHQQLDQGIAEERATSYLKFIASDNGLRLDEINRFESFLLSCPSHNIINPSGTPSVTRPNNFHMYMDKNVATNKFDENVSHQAYGRQLSQPLAVSEVQSVQLKLCVSTGSLCDCNRHNLIGRHAAYQREFKPFASNSFARRMKHFKYSSQNSLSKKMIALKEKLSESTMHELEDYEINSMNSKDEKLSTRSSLTDLREIRKKNKAMFLRTSNSQNHMAELLVKSIMHTNLDGILETHDSLSTSTPKLSEEILDKNNDVCENSCRLSPPMISKTASEPYLVTPDSVLETNSSLTSSSSESSSSDEDEEESFSNLKEEENIELDTVSLIVKHFIETEHQQENESLKNYDYEHITSGKFINELAHSSVFTDNKNDYEPNKYEEITVKLEPSTDISFSSSGSSHTLVCDIVENTDIEDVNSKEQYEKSEEICQLNELLQKSESEQTDLEASKHLVRTAMQTMLLDKVHIMTPNFHMSSLQSNVSSSNTEHSLYQILKEKLKSVKKSTKSNFISKYIKKYKIKKQSRQHKLSSNKNNKVSLQESVTIQSQPEPSSSLNNEHIIQCSESPNINLGLDSFKAMNSANINNNDNAEHAPCLIPSHRYAMESPVPIQSQDIQPTITVQKHGHQRTESTGGKMSQSPARLNAVPCIHRRSSDSDLSITPKGNSLTGSDRSAGAMPGYHHMRSSLLRPAVDNFDMMEYPFLTISKYPSGFILHLGGAVSARSVKLLERITNIEEPETRDTWWSELRMEIRSHARALNCNAVLGYLETTSICDEVCVLSASGTAAVISMYSGEVSDAVASLPLLNKPHFTNRDLMTSSLDRTDFERDKTNKVSESGTANIKIPQVTESPEQETNNEYQPVNSVQTSCRVCHIPYNETNVSFRVTMLYCAVCKIAKVPDVLLTTIEMPEGLPSTGRGCFLQSYVCRPKRDLKGELNAKEISESLPFLEYELHRLLVNKMKVKGMNTIFGLKVRITIGEKMLIGIATGTAVYLLPLPIPPLPKLVAGNSTTDEKKLQGMQKLLVDTVKKNREIYELKTNLEQDIIQTSRILSDTEESDEEKNNLDLAIGNKDSCVLEVDDSEDIEVINLLIEPRPPDGFHVVNTENVPGLEELEIVKNLQMFTQIWRAKIPLNQPASHFGKHFQKLLQSVYFKLRRMIPCALCDLEFRVDLPEPDEIQLTLLGMALGLGDPTKSKFKRKTIHSFPSKDLKKPDDDLIFSLEEDHIPENSIPVIPQTNLLNTTQSLKYRQKSPQRFKVKDKQRHMPIKERHGVDITPLSYVPGGKIERYLGYLNFFFIRESNSIREGGGLSGFVHSFVTEVLAIIRAHVTALGGNAMVAYFLTECVLYHSAHKNQGQCLINVGGDVVFVSYFTEDV